jgi:hypothetical protein
MIAYALFAMAVIPRIEITRPSIHDFFYEGED